MLQPITTAIKCVQMTSRAKKMAPDAKDAAGPLARTLGDADVNVRRASAAALGKIGPEAKVAVGALQSARQDGDQRVRDAATYSLAKISKP